MPTNNNINYGPAPLPGTVTQPVLGNNIDRAPAPVVPSPAIGATPSAPPTVVPITEQPVVVPVAITNAVIPVTEQPVDLGGNANAVAGPNLTASNQQRYITVLANGAVVITNATSLNFAGSGVSVSASGTTGANITISGGGGNANLGNLAIDNYNIYNTNGQGVVISNFSFIDEAETAYVQIPAGNSTANLNIVQTQGNVRIAANAAAWLFDDTGNLTLPDGTSFQNFGPSSSEWHAGANGYVSLASNNGNTYMWVDNNGAYIATNWIPGAYQWTFDANGQTIPPALSVARGDNPSGNISGYTLNLGNGSQEAIITTPDGDADGNPDSQRIVINPGKGADTTSGEGGDIYLWAGRGGNAGGTGGDVKIRGGQGMVDGGGGYIRIEGGDSQGAGAGGYIDLIGGTSTTNTGGPIQIQSGQGVAGANIDLTGGTGTDGPGGNINITGGVSANGLAEYGNIFINAGASTWTFDNTGNLSLPGANTGETIATQDGYITVGNLLIGQGGSLFNSNNDTWALYGNTSDPDATITIPSNLATANGVALSLQVSSNIEITAGGNTWTFDNTGIMTAPGAINVGDMSIGTVPGDITANANTGVTLNVSGPNGGFSVNYLDEVGNANTSGGELAFSSETGNATYRISLSDDLGDGFATKIWRFDGTGNFNLPSGGNIVGVTAYNSGSIQWVGNSSGDGAGYTTLQLVPDDTLTGNDQYLIIDPTAPGHIHIRAGGTQDNSSADLFLGGENSYFKVNAGANNEVRISANSHAWVFGADSVLTLPGEGILRSIGDVVTLQSYNVGTGNVNSVYLGSGGGLGFFDQDIGGNWLEIFRSGAEPQIRVPVGLGNLNIQTAQGNTAYDWVFDNTGNLTTPGNISATGNVTAEGLLIDTVAGITANAGNVTINQITGLGGYLNATGGVFSGTVSVTGNITAGNFIGGGSNVELVAGSYTATFDNTGNLTVPTNVNTSGLLVDTVTGITANAGNIDINQVTGMGGYLNATGVSVTGNVTGNTAGFAIGYRDIPQVSFSANATAALTDAGKHYYSTTAGNLALTLPDNSNVALPTGATLTVVVNAAGNVLVNQGTGVSLYMAGSSTTGNRVVGAYGLASVMKVAANTWVISGTGVY